MKNRKMLCLKIIFIIFALVVIFKSIDLSDVLYIFSNITFSFFYCVLFICLLDQIIMGLKWNLLLKVFNVNVSYKIPVLAYLRCRVFYMFTPSIIGLDVYKTYFIKKFGGSTSSVISSILLERILGICSSIAVIFLFLYFSLGKYYPQHTFIVTVAGFVGFCLLIVCLFFIIQYSQKLSLVKLPQFLPYGIRNKLYDILFSLSKIKGDKKRIWYYYFFSIFEKLCYGSAIYFSAKAVNFQQIEYMYIISATPLFAILERLPISISAIGVREGLFVVLLKPYFLEAVIPITIALVLRCSEVIIALFSLMLWLFNPEEKWSRERLEIVKKEVNTFRVEVK